MAMKSMLTFFAPISVLYSTEAAFTFVLQINGHSTSGRCDTFLNPSCETYFSLFCLRGPRTDTSTEDINDCPLGVNRQRFDRGRGRISIQSSSEWRGGFQLLIQAFDVDDFNADDHLDDIFVEGSLMDNTLSPAMTFKGLDNRVSVTVQFQRICDEHFYGLSCLIHCVPADNDILGHFTCNALDGSKICLQGFSNPDNYCKTNIDDCASGPCHNGGNCTDLVADFMCTCPTGYTGKDCSVNINECKDTRCPGNSTCVDSINSFTCVCNPGYTGEACTEVLNPCESGPCGTGGSCVVLDPYNFTCVCLAGYTGPLCEVNIDECLTSQCTSQSEKSESENNISILVVGSLIATVFILVCTGCVLCVIHLLIRKRQKIKKLGSEGVEMNDLVTLHSNSEDIEFNTPYARTDCTASSDLQPLTGSLHVCDNSLYFPRGHTENLDESAVETVTEDVSTMPGDRSSIIEWNGHFLNGELTDHDVISQPEINTPPSNQVLPTRHISNFDCIYTCNKMFPHYETAEDLPASNTSIAQVHYETIDESHFNGDQDIPHPSQNNGPCMPSSYDQLHHTAANSTVHKVPTANKQGYTKLQYH